jgi:hypothetical protein
METGMEPAHRSGNARGCGRHRQIHRLALHGDRVKRQFDGVLGELSGVLGIVPHEFVDERGIGSWLRECELIEYGP